MPTIHFNGKTYNSLEEMPQPERQAYEQLTDMFVDKNGNGIPDFLEGDIVKNISNIYTTASAINFDGNTYHNFNELPSDVQSKVKTAFNTMSSMGLAPENTYDEHASKHTVHNEDYVKSTPFVSREYHPVIQEDSASNIKIWLLIGLAFMACLGAMAIAVFIFYFV
jgi:hypothetical protein